MTEDREQPPGVTSAAEPEAVAAPVAALTVGPAVEPLPAKLIDALLEDLQRSAGLGKRAFWGVSIVVFAAFIGAGGPTAWLFGAVFGFIFGGMSRVLTRELHYAFKVRGRWRDVGVSPQTMEQLLRYRSWDSPSEGRAWYHAEEERRRQQPRLFRRRGA